MRRFFEKHYRTIFRPTPLVSLPWTLKRMSIYILPTRYGLLLILILAGMLLGSINHNNNLGFLLTFLLSGMIFISIMYTYRNLIGIEIVSATAEPVYAEDKAVLELILRAGNLYRPSVSIGLSDGENLWIDLDSNIDHRIKVMSPPARRGLFRPGPLLFSSQYPFALFYSWSKLYIDIECLVYPKPIPSIWSSVQNPETGGGKGNSSGSGVDDFLGLKPYQSGDSLQHVSWKAFSSGQGLFTKTFTGEAGLTTMINWFDVKETDRERRLSILCDQVLKAHRTNTAYGLSLPGKNIPPNRGEAHRRNCLKALALFGLSAQDQ